MPPRTGTLTVVAFGDSITQASHQEAPYRWVTLVQDQLNRRLSDTAAAVLNAGAGGETSREGLRRLQRDVLDVRPDIVLVEFGGNDATPDDGRQVGLEEFGDNLHLISTECRKIHAQVMILTFPPIIDAWHCWGRHDRYAETNGPNAHVERYRQAARRYACDHRLALIDIARLLEEAARKDSPQSIILPDGVHLTQAGNRIVAQAVADAIVARQRPPSDV